MSTQRSLRVSLALWASCALTIAMVGCDSSAPPVDRDPRCGMPGIAADQPSIGCPSQVDLGCIDSSGAPLSFEVSTATCDDSPVTVRCSPERGSIVMPGASQSTCMAVAGSGAMASCDVPIRYRVSGAPMLVCAPELRVACSAALTPATPLPASAMASCEGGEVGTPTSDAPAGGFPVGTTTVTWMASVTGGAGLSCSHDVIVEDAMAPALDCSASAGTVVRLSADAAIDVPAPTVSDLCDDDVTLTIAPEIDGRGTFDVTATATDDAGNESTCEFAVRVLDVFAPTGLRVISAQLGGDGSTDVTIGWEASLGADVMGYRVARSATETGAYTELMTVGSDVSTFVDADMPGMVAWYRVTAIGPDDIEGGVAGPVRALAIGSQGYDLSGQTVPGIGFPTSLYGVVRHPRDLSAGPYPLVLFLHGNHGNCRPSDPSRDDTCETRTQHACTRAGFTTTPNAEGYVYLMETLAAQGYVSASISANAINCREDNIAERVQLIVEHLRRWGAWAGAGAAPFGATFAGAVDTSRVALVGHSRGGDAVGGVPAALRSTPVAGVTLASVFAIGPTDFHDYRPSGVPYAVLLPGCDADVATLEGAHIYDRGLDPADPSVRAQVMYSGANHNFFNSEWRFDDNSFRAVCSAGSRVGEVAQRGMLEIVLSDWIDANASGERIPAYIRSEVDTPSIVEAWAGRAIDLRWAYEATSRSIVDDFSAAMAPDRNTLGGTNTWEGFAATITCTGSCARNLAALTGRARIAWDAAPAAVTFATGGYDATAYSHFSVRFASRIATFNDGVEEHGIVLRVTDGAGVSGAVTIGDYGRIPGAAGSHREVLSSVRVPVAALSLAAPTLDLSSIASLALEVPSPGGNPRGTIWIADLEFTGPD